MIDVYDFNMFPNRPARAVEFVSGPSQAKAYPLNPGESAVLMDTDRDVFYLVRCDGYGPVQVRTFEFTEVDRQDGQPCLTVSDVEKIVERMLNEHDHADAVS